MHPKTRALALHFRNGLLAATDEQLTTELDRLREQVDLFNPEAGAALDRRLGWAFRSGDTGRRYPTLDALLASEPRAGRWESVPPRADHLRNLLKAMGPEAILAVLIQPLAIAEGREDGLLALGRPNAPGTRKGHHWLEEAIFRLFRRLGETAPLDTSA